MIESRQDINPLEPFNNAPKEIQKIIKDVLKLEKEMLSQTRPRLKSEVVNVIKEAIKNED